MQRRLFPASLIAIGLIASTAAAAPTKVLIITGDSSHKWQETTPFLKDLLLKAGMEVEVTETGSKDVTAENLAKYDVFVLNYNDAGRGKPESRWSDENKKAFNEAVNNGKGLVVYHHASCAFSKGNKPIDKEFERAIAGGWRARGNHGKRHDFKVAIRKDDHPIMKGMPAEFQQTNDELYQNSLMFPESVVLATAYADSKVDPKNSGKHEPVVWVTTYGKGRVCENVLGHDVDTMKSLGFQTLLVRCVEWAATGEVKHPVPAGLK